MFGFITKEKTPPQTFEIRFKGKTIAAITTLEEADKVNLDRYLVDFEFDN